MICHAHRLWHCPVILLPHNARSFWTPLLKASASLPKEFNQNIVAKFSVVLWISGLTMHMATAQTESQICFPFIFGSLLQAVLSGFNPLLANAKYTCLCMYFHTHGPSAGKSRHQRGKARDDL